MVRIFAAINGPFHALLRSITRQTPLCPRATGNGGVVMEYDIQPDRLPTQYFDLAARRMSGLGPFRRIRLTPWNRTPRENRWLIAQAGYFDVTRLDWRCARDLRLKPQKHGPGLLSAELLTFGTGVLRARNDLANDPLQHRLSQRHGRIVTPFEVVYGRIRALPWNALPLLGNSEKESFDSTNLVYGDSLGELEQLWERRTDMALLDLVAASLQPFRLRGELADHLCPPLNVDAVAKLHLRAQSCWRVPPANGRVLLRRLEFLLDRMVVDDAPKTLFDSSHPQPADGDSSWAGAARDWSSDASGYDGWLTSGDSSPDEGN
jgi:hypothetical protein